MTNRLGTMTLCLISAIIVGGCGVRKVEGPPTIRYGQTACSECRMLINEERFAASLVTADDEVEVFDAVECLIRRLGHHRPGSLKQAWVHDYEAPQWLNASGAFFVRSAELATPMGQGLVTLGTEQAALKLAARVHGQVMRFNELLQAAEEPS